MGKGQRDDHGRVKFRLIEFEFEGGNASIQESVKNIASALQFKREQVIALPTPADRPASVDTQTPEAGGSEAVQPDLVQGGSASSSAYRRPKAVRSPTVLDLDLTSGDVPLKSFCLQLV